MTPMPNLPRSRSRVLARTLAVTCTLAVVPVVAVVGASAATAASLPTVPDSIFPVVAENPEVTVTFEDGTPVTASTVVHRGDVLLVHGAGFSPEANRGGFVAPILPGVPNGVYVLYSAFDENWRPSQGAPGETRTHPHDQMAWVLPDSSLNALPGAPLDMRTPISRESQRMDADGSFTARIVVNPPAQTPGKNYGVYVYPAAGSINAAEELFVPLNFSTAPGKNTPATASADLVLDASVISEIASAAGGKLAGRDGAQVLDGSKIAFSREPGQNSAASVVQYRGTIHATARFSMADVVIKDPQIISRADGSRVIKAWVSDSYNASDDHVTFRELGTLGTSNGVTGLFLGPVLLSEVAIAE